MEQTSTRDQEVTETEKIDDKMEMSEEITAEVQNKEPTLINEEELRTQEKIISTQESLQPMSEEFESESASSTSETTSDKSNEQISTELSTNLQKIQLPERKRRRHRKRRKKSNMLVNIVQEIIPVQKKVVCNNFTKCRSIHVRFDENGNPDKDIVSLRAPKIIKARIVKAFEVNLTVFDESKCELVDAEKTLEIEKSENFTEILKPRIIKAIEV